MSFDYSKLDGLITEKCGTRATFANLINLSERSVSLKMNGKVGWKQQEIDNVCKALGIESKDIPAYFFKLKVQSD